MESCFVTFVRVASQRTEYKDRNLGSCCKPRQMTDQILPQRELLTQSGQ